MTARILGIGLALLGLLAIYLWMGRDELSVPATEPPDPNGVAKSSTRSIPVAEPRAENDRLAHDPADHATDGPKPLETSRDLKVFRFISGLTREPLPSLRISVDGKDLTTDGTGRAAWDPDYVFTITSPGFAGTEVEIQCDVQALVEPIIVPLYPTSTFVGSVQDVDGNAVPGVHVQVYAHADADLPSDGLKVGFTIPKMLETDGAGQFRIEGVPANSLLSLILDLGDFLQLIPEHPIRIRPGQTGKEAWVLPPWGSVWGVVRDQASRPVSRACISLSDAVSNLDAAWTSTTDSGEFRLAHVPCGAFLLRVAPARGLPNDRIFERRSETVSLGHHGATAYRVVTVHRGLVIRGFVTGPAGEPVAGATVVAEPAEDRARRRKNGREHAVAWGYFGRRAASKVNGPWDRTRKDGSFELVRLRPVEYRVHVKQHGAYAASPPVRLRAGAVAVTLRVPLAGAVSGRFDPAPASTSARPSMVQLYLTRRGSHRSLAWFKSAQGFEVEGLIPGVYDLYARTRTGLAGRLRGVRIRAGETVRNLTIHLSAGGWVRFLAVDGSPPAPATQPGEEPCERTFNWRMYEGGALVAAGESALRSGRIAVPPGTLQVVVERKDRTDRREHTISVAAGATVVLAIP